MSNWIEEQLSGLTVENPPEEWNEISNSRKLDLIKFYNVSIESLSEDDLEILADLYHGITGSIRWETCDECFEELCIAEPNSWDSFQGVICSNEDNYMQECCVKFLVGSDE